MTRQHKICFWCSTNRAVALSQCSCERTFCVVMQSMRFVSCSLCAACQAAFDWLGRTDLSALWTAAALPWLPGPVVELEPMSSPSCVVVLLLRALLWFLQSGHGMPHWAWPQIVSCLWAWEGSRGVISAMCSDRKSCLLLIALELTGTCEDFNCWDADVIPWDGWCSQAMLICRVCKVQITRGWGLVLRAVKVVFEMAHAPAGQRAAAQSSITGKFLAITNYTRPHISLMSETIPLLRYAC